MSRERVAEVEARLAGPPGAVHLAGVGGVGMGGIAYLLHQRGWRVSGCDLAANRVTAWLQAAGLDIRIGHAADHLTPETAWMVRSTAVAPDLPELAAAGARGVPVFRRGEVLPALLTGRTSVAVCGTHGKTTTSTFIAQILHAAGLAPSWCIGGEPGWLGGVAGTGRGNVLVVEADESDGTLALYTPDYTVITNVEFDHMEHFAGPAAFEACFATVAAATRRRVLYCADDPRAASVTAAVPGALAFGFGPHATLRGSACEGTEREVRFRVSRDGVELGELTVPAPGQHNALNALAATAVALELGVPFPVIRTALARVALPRRRFDRIASACGVQVISDYAHHPSEIAAFVRTAGQLDVRRRLAVFQPHRYTRTLALGTAFPPAFAGLDEVVLAPVYAASEAPLRGGTVWDLYGHMRRYGEQHGGPRVLVADGLAEAWAYLRRQLRTGDALLVIGAGSVEQVAFDAGTFLAAGGDARAADGAFCAALTRQCPGLVVRLDEPAGARTTLGVGGSADVWVEAATEAEVAAALACARAAGLPARVLGGGSNVLFSDTGARGVTVRLAGAELRRVRVEGDLVVAGAAVTVSSLLQWLDGHGWGGLEFMEGIPGTLGGCLRMNAGAWGGELNRHVAWIRCLNPDGSLCIVSDSELRYGYRECATLAQRVAVAAALRLPRVADGVASRRQRADFARKRTWMHGLRTAGSTFRNPPGAFAGRLLEEAGLFGARIGGARVTTKHANVLVAESGATASDVRALMEKMRGDVQDRSGVTLTPELCVWG